MSEIEKMQKYIERTKVPQNIRYSMNPAQAFELAKDAQTGDDLPIKLFSLAFDYGRAKGYRMAKAEVRR